MSYNVAVSVNFDPCALKPHDFEAVNFGLASLTKMEKCTRCGAVRFPRFELGGINRETTAWSHA